MGCLSRWIDKLHRRKRIGSELALQESTLELLVEVVLKANANFGKLQDELTDTENKIQASRRFYNTVVLDYNTKLQVFPTNMIAGPFNFQKEEFFQLDSPEEAKLPEVKF